MLHGWGRQDVPGREIASEDLESITRGAGLCRGLGRSYGDSSLPPPGRPEVVSTLLADRLLAFDATTGILRAEAGLALHELNRIFLPRCWFPPITPGTQMVTLGGMVASDVHGKNHHVAGTFGRHLTRLKMRLAGGDLAWCSPTDKPDLFWATVGGMGLTGHILEVEFRMERVPSPWIYEESWRCPDLDSLILGLKEAAARYPMTVAWVDCLKRGKHLGRGRLMAGRWATPDEAPRPLPPAPGGVPIPFVFPDGLLNPFTIGVFNAGIYHSHPRARRHGIKSPWPFFYPLDIFKDWNRGYGPRGLTQHQAVLPTDHGTDGVRRYMEKVTSLGAASFLCVLKDCGPEGQGILSFPRPGISVALDLPVRADTQRTIDQLNEAVLAEGGRIYLTKDGFTRPEHFAAMEPRLKRFNEVRRVWDPDLRLRSAQSVRMLGDPPYQGA